MADGHERGRQPGQHNFAATDLKDAQHVVTPGGTHRYMLRTPRGSDRKFHVAHHPYDSQKEVPFVVQDSPNGGEGKASRAHRKAANRDKKKSALRKLDLWSREMHNKQAALSVSKKRQPSAFRKLDMGIKEVHNKEAALSISQEPQHLIQPKQAGDVQCCAMLCSAVRCCAVQCSTF